MKRENMNIVLVHPYITVRSRDTHLSEPLGLVCLATYLEEVFGEWVSVNILDLYALGADRPARRGDMYVKGIDEKEAIKQKLERMKPDLIGITCCFTGYIEDALNVARIAKGIYPEVPVVMGGAHVTIEAKSILENNSFVDFVIRNEGEITLEMLIRSLNGEVNIFDINGLCFRDENNTIIINPPRELISNLDDLPIPNRKFVNMEHYKRANYNLFNFSRKKPIATIMTSRGCPYECIFCCTKNIWKRKWRPRSLENVFEEIEQLHHQYGIMEFVVLDDQFILNKKRINDFCDYFIRRDLNISFSNVAGISAWLADDDEILKKMRLAGFYKITLPIESGNDETLKIIKKPVDLEQVKRLVVKANKLGYWTGGFFIIGFPRETREKILETVRFAYESNLDFAHFFVAQPYLGTELYEMYKMENLLGDSIIPGTFIFHGWHDTVTMKAEELNRIQAKASGGWLLHKILYYIKPHNFKASLYPKFETMEDFRYSFGVFFMLLYRNTVTRFQRLFS